MAAPGGSNGRVWRRRFAGLAGAVYLAAGLAASPAVAGDWCLAPAGGIEITEVDCRPPVADPRCEPPCQLPPCAGYPYTVRPAARFIWRGCPPAVRYRLTVRNLISGDERILELSPADYFRNEDGTCTAHPGLAACLPAMDSPGEPAVPAAVAAELGLRGPATKIPMVGRYEWQLEALLVGGYRLLERETFVYFHNSNPFGTAAIEFRWRTGGSSDDCGGIEDPVDFWIHLPMEYPDDHPHRSGYEWGYVLVQASSELLGAAPELGADYELERIPLPDGPAAENLRLWLRGRRPDTGSQLAYHLVFTLDDPWSEVGWQPESEFDLDGTPMPGTRDLWPAELVAAGYLDDGPQTAPASEILANYVWCDPYPACMACPWQVRGAWYGTCRKGPYGSFCRPSAEPADLDPDDRRTWRGTNALDWFRRERIARPEAAWTVEANLRALDRLMARWPIPAGDRLIPWIGIGAAYDQNSLLRLFDPASGMEVDDHWRFTDAAPLPFFKDGLGCSNASTHFGLAMARLMNFPARAACLAHYHNDLELWLPFGPPSGERYRLDEGRWIRFLGEDIAAAKTELDPPDSAAGPLQSIGLAGIFKTTAYVTWDAEDSIPFNWYRGGTEPDFVPCRGRLVDRQWPAKLTGLALPDETVRLLAVAPGRVDLAAGEGFATLRGLGGSEDLGRWFLAQHLIPLGFERYGYVRWSGDRLLFEVFDAALAPVSAHELHPGAASLIEEPGRLRLAFRTVAADPYVLLQVEEYAPSWSPPLPTPTPALSPTPAPPCESLQVDLAMPAHWFEPGDPCGLTVQACNPGPPIEDAPLFVVLAAGGEYWFAPSWAHWPGGGVDCYRCQPLASGLTAIEVIAPFAWPPGAGQADGLAFLAAVTDPGMSALASPLAVWEFGCGP